MDSNAFLNDLMSKMKLPEAKGKEKAEQSESVAQILAAMQKVRAEKKKPPVTSYAPVKEMPVNEPESMEEFSQLASDVMQECRPSMPTVKTSISEKTVRVAAYIRVSSTNPAQEDSYEMQERYFMSLLAGNAGWTSAGIYSDHGISATSREGRTGFNRLLRHCKQRKIDRVICKSISRFARNTQDFLVALRTLKENNVTILFEREAMDTADAEVHEVMQMVSKVPIDSARNQALKNLTEKLREIHDFDHMEQEGDFLKRQLSAVNYSIRDVHQHIRDIQAEKEALKVRCEVLGEPIDKESVTELENRLLDEEEQLEKLEHEAQQQAEQVRYMEDYWKKLEQTYEIREKTLQWLDSLAGGTQMFLNEATGTYVKAFVLSVTIFSPKHFRIHWFDDTCTDVECDSVFEGYQQPGMIRRKY